VMKFKNTNQTNASEENFVLSKLTLPIKRPFTDESRVTNTIKLVVYIRTAEGKTLSLTKDYDVEACDVKTAVQW